MCLEPLFRIFVSHTRCGEQFVAPAFALSGAVSTKGAHFDAPRASVGKWGGAFFLSARVCEFV